MGDVVVALNGEDVSSQTEFMEELARQRAGERVRLGIIRYGQRLDKQVELGEFESAAPRVAPPAARPRSQELLGFSVEPITAEIARQIETNIRSGVVINAVDPLGSAVGSVGRGDVIRSINGRTVNTVADVERAAQALRPGQTVSLVVRRPGRDYDTILNYRVR